MRDILSEALLKASTPTSKPRKIEPSKTSRIDLFAFVKNDRESRLRGVYHDPSGWAVASDGTFLVASCKEFNPEYSGKIVNAAGHELPITYPNWRGAIPKNGAPLSLLDAEDVARCRKQFRDTMRQCGLKPKDCFLRYKVGSQWFDLERLYKVSKFTPMLETTAECKAAKYVTNDLIVLVMPLSPDCNKDIEHFDASSYSCLVHDSVAIDQCSRTASASATAEPKRKFNNPLAI